MKALAALSASAVLYCLTAVMLVAGSTSLAQERTMANLSTSDAPAPKIKTGAELAFAVKPNPTTREPRFYSGKATKIILVAELGLEAADMSITCSNLGHGGVEKVLPTQSCAGAIGYTLMYRAAGELGAYLLHRMHHHKLEQVPRLLFTVDSARGLGYSVKKR